MSQSLVSGGKKRKRCVEDDPSLEYFEDPVSAPAVRKWRSLFPGQSVYVGSREGHRTVVKLCCRRQEGEDVLGLFAPGTHRVAAQSARSPAQSERLNEAISCAERAMRGARQRGYENGEAADSRTLNYVCLSEERSTRRVSVVFVFNAREHFAGVDELVARTRRECARAEVALHSIVAHLNAVSPHDNAIYGRHGTWEQLWPRAVVRGSEWPSSGLVTERLFDDGPLLHFAPPTFRQANLDQFAAIVRTAATFVPPGATVVELYAGVGTIGAHLATKAASVFASDENPYNAHCVRLTGNRRLRYETKPAALVAREGALADADVVVVDPPRKGLCPDVLHALIALPRDKTTTLVYVSCGFDAFQRDLARLRAAEWRLRHVEGHLLFPGANHVETLAVLTSNDALPREPVSRRDASDRKKRRKRSLERRPRGKVNTPPPSR